MKMLNYKKVALAVGLSAFVLSGCANNASNTQKGAGIGAVVGAIIGKGTGDHDKSRYAWGAVVGAIAGGAIGKYMDDQEKEFRDELADSGVEVQRDGDTLKLIMPGSITFDTGKANIASNFYPVLNDVALVINKYEKTTLQVVGHTDNVGSDNQNQQLSEFRSMAVKSYLAEQNVDNRRVTTSGMGESQPVASNDTPAGRQKNRRVELTIVPLKG